MAFLRFSVLLIALLIGAALTFQLGQADASEDFPCKVKLQMTKEVPGKCVRLLGDRVGCVANGYMDVSNTECYGLL